VAVTYQVYTERSAPTLKALVARGVRSRATQEVRAVRGVSFDVHEGEAIGLIGPNGSGKSTLLRAVAGLLRTTAGEIRVRSMPVLLGVGAALEPELSGRRNVVLGGTALGMSRDEVAARFDDIVDFAGVREFIDLPLKAFSSGMAARLRFSIASALQPDVLMIDEALSVGDAEFRRRSRERMRELISKAGVIFLVSHSLQQVLEVCDRVIWLEKGVVARDGPAAEVVAAYRDATGG
jgi:teichoic acid transport system ATP-binding protein